MRKNTRKFRRHSRRGGFRFGNPIKGLKNLTGRRLNRNKRTKQELMIGMAPIRDYQTVVNARVQSFQLELQNINNIMQSEMNNLKTLVPACREECIMTMQAADADSVEFARKMNPLTLCSTCAVPPYQIPNCELVEESRKTIEAYLSVLQNMVQSYQNEFAMLER